MTTVHSASPLPLPLQQASLSRLNFQFLTDLSLSVEEKGVWESEEEEEGVWESEEEEEEKEGVWESEEGVCGRVRGWMG
ncbi:hypothetical protein Pmani_028169 [Petrolisthes manimaculis]|uniref:Uncharacterized protein n=1 Tax=Petrolisthes manimaculis TaxID=1843537 RepID=A0AAE1P2P0_9EUCA|nr:hypothetical protein Pmani_028169 [Petrolisthes manimaculis]